MGQRGVWWDRLGLPYMFIRILYPWGSNKESIAVVVDTGALGLPTDLVPQGERFVK